jgi:hypothetical protein
VSVAATLLLRRPLVAAPIGAAAPVASA